MSKQVLCKDFSEADHKFLRVMAAEYDLTISQIIQACVYGIRTEVENPDFNVSAVQPFANTLEILHLEKRGRYCPSVECMTFVRNELDQCPRCGIILDNPNDY
jgi:hypothetical protein